MGRLQQLHCSLHQSFSVFCVANTNFTLCLTQLLSLEVEAQRERELQRLKHQRHNTSGNREEDTNDEEDRGKVAKV